MSCALYSEAMQSCVSGVSGHGPGKMVIVLVDFIRLLVLCWFSLISFNLTANLESVSDSALCRNVCLPITIYIYHIYKDSMMVQQVTVSLCSSRVPDYLI